MDGWRGTAHYEDLAFRRARRRFIALGLLAAVMWSLAGCGPALVGNSASVIIADGTNQNRAFALAEQHCAQYGKVARFNRMDGQRGSYDCVAK